MSNSFKHDFFTMYEAEFERRKQRKTELKKELIHISHVVQQNEDKLKDLEAAFKETINDIADAYFIDASYESEIISLSKTVLCSLEQEERMLCSVLDRFIQKEQEEQQNNITKMMEEKFENFRRTATNFKETQLMDQQQKITQARVELNRQFDDIKLDLKNHENTLMNRQTDCEKSKNFQEGVVVHLSGNHSKLVEKNETIVAETNDEETIVSELKLKIAETDKQIKIVEDLQKHDDGRK